MIPLSIRCHNIPQPDSVPPVYSFFFGANIFKMKKSLSNLFEFKMIGS
jgi:hypothetical protein